MKLKFLLIFLQITNIFNTITEDDINNAEYSKPFIYDDQLYILYNGKILNNNYQNFIEFNSISHSFEIGTPLIKDEYFIIINANSATDIQYFQFIKIKMETDSKTSTEIHHTSSLTKQSNNNICLFQMQFDSTDYYYYVSWIDKEFYINLVKFDSGIIRIHSTKNQIL